MKKGGQLWMEINSMSAVRDCCWRNSNNTKHYRHSGPLYLLTQLQTSKIIAVGGVARARVSALPTTEPSDTATSKPNLLGFLLGGAVDEPKKTELTPRCCSEKLENHQRVSRWFWLNWCLSDH
jgi:hypothetical protein